jgi:phosphoserine phosphatase
VLYSPRVTYCAFFDVDHTLVRGSTGTAFGKELWRANVVGFRDLARVLVWNVMYLAGQIDEIEIWKRSVERLFGKREEPIKKACVDAHARTVRSLIYKEGAEEILRHKKRGAHVAMISAGPRYSVLEVARDLGVEHASTSWANVVDGRVHDLEGVEIPYGPMKRVYAERHCAERFPCFIGPTRSSDVLPPIPPRFVSFAWRYQRRAPTYSLSAGAERDSNGPGLVPPVALPAFPLETAGPPRFLANPVCTCPAL